MVKKILPCLLFSLCSAADNLYFIDEPESMELESGVVKDDLYSDSDSKLPYELVSSKEFLANRATYLLGNKSWYSVSLSQAKVALGGTSDFSKESYIWYQTGLEVTAEKTKTQTKALSFSFMTRNGQYAYGMNLDYMTDISKSISDIKVGNPLASIAGGAPVAMTLDLIPIMFNARFYPFDGYWIQPFMGVGIGTTYQKAKVTVGSTSYSDSAWSLWSTNLEAGATFCLNESYSIDFSLQNQTSQFKSPHIISKDSGGNFIYDVRLKSPMSLTSLKVSFNVYSG